MKSLKLGATLYIPALHRELVAVGNKQKFANLRSVVFCTEDAVLEKDLPAALENLKAALTRLEKLEINRFIRPRNPEVLAEILTMGGLDLINGFVLPKADLDTLPAYFKVLEKHEQFELMPTMETVDVFDIIKLYKLRDYLVASPSGSRISAIRIGALDLLSILGLRRDISHSIYETPLGHVIDQIITVFKPAGFSLTAPGYESFSNNNGLIEELKLDVARGLFAKTALHPQQIDIIHQAYMVDSADMEAALAIKDDERPAVFRFNDRMCEKAVHTNWASTIMERARLYGVRKNNDVLV